MLDGVAEHLPVAGDERVEDEVVGDEVGGAMGEGAFLHGPSPRLIERDREQSGGQAAARR